jgi:hypothetical protein
LNIDVEPEVFKPDNRDFMEVNLELNVVSAELIPLYLSFLVARGEILRLYCTCL